MPPGLTGWGLHPHVPAGYWDYSPLTHGIEYCASVGVPTMPDGVLPRADCPVRVDLHPEREACEDLIVGGKPEVRCEFGLPDFRGPYLAACGEHSSWIEVCGRKPGAVCKRCPTATPYDSTKCKSYTKPTVTGFYQYTVPLVGSLPELPGTTLVEASGMFW